MTEGNTAFPWTFDATFDPSPNWLLDGQRVGRVTDEVATFSSLSLTIRTTTETLERVLRPLKSDEGKVATLPTDDGGYTAVDRADGGNTFTFKPPVRREPLRFERPYHVERYEESLVSQDLGEFDVELELVPDTNRTDRFPLELGEQDASELSTDEGGTLGAADGFTLGGTDGANLSGPRSIVPADQWGFETVDGEIVTDRVDAEFTGTGADGVERFEVVVRLTFDQATTFEAALALQNGTRVRERPDTTNVIADATAAESNTLTIDAPDGQDTVTDGDYVVTEWEATRLNDRYQSVSFVIAPT